jgi:hypothetical protein
MVTTEVKASSGDAEENGLSVHRGISPPWIVPGLKVSRMPHHPAKEIKTGTLQSVLKDLDLEM